MVFELKAMLFCVSNYIFEIFASTVYGAYTGHETFDIGRYKGMPVNEEYVDKGKFKFTEGQLHKVVFDIE